MPHKCASQYPLPGGMAQYVNFLITLLKRVTDAPPEQQESVDFVLQEYPRTRGSTAVGQYLAHITRSGLWTIKSGLPVNVPPSYFNRQPARSRPRERRG